MGYALSSKSSEFFQLYLYIVSVVRLIESNPVFTLYSNDERSRETAGSRYDLEKSVYGIGLGVLSNCLENILLYIIMLSCLCKDYCLYNYQINQSEYNEIMNQLENKETFTITTLVKQNRQNDFINFLIVLADKYYQKKHF